MMRQMREHTKWIMLVTALAFVALMVFEWGMDMTGRSSGGLGEIGRVNGRSVMYEEYIATYRNLYEEVQRGQGQPITSSQNRELEEAAWEQVVTRILIQQELDRRGIRVTDEEIRDAALFSPPPAFVQAPEFQTDGAFDMVKYQTFIRSPQVDDFTLLYLESYYRDVIPRGKLLRQITSGIYPTDAELWQDWRDQNERVVVGYVALDPAQRIADSDVTVTDGEVRAYYNANRDDFQTPAQATVRFLSLSKAPTASDSAVALETVQSLRQEILSGTAFSEVAQRASADSATAPEGGSLGTFGRNFMTPAFEEAAFAAPLGEVTEPVQTPFGYHLILVEGRTTDSVTASHILVPVEPTEASEFRMLSLADSLERISDRQGLDAAAAELGLEVRTAVLNALFPFLVGVGQAAEGADWAFEEAAPGDVSLLFENSEAFYQLELVQATPAGTLSLEDATETIGRVLRTRKKIERAVEEGRSMVERIRAGETMTLVASASGLEVGTAGPFTRNDFVPVLGAQNAAIGAAFGLQPSQVSDPVATDSNVFIVQQVLREPADSAAWELQKDGQREELIYLEQQRRMDLWVEGIRAAANVVDRRRQVLQPVEDDDLARRSLPGPFGR